MKHLIASLAVVVLAALSLKAQQYCGMTGLINVPTAEMDSAGQARIGVHYLNGHFTPDSRSWYEGDKKYNTGDMYLSITPFKWVEIGYVMTLFKVQETDYPNDKPGYNRKDRYFTLKFTPLHEGKWWPSVSVGANDILSTGFLRNNNTLESTTNTNNGFFRTYYLALTKGIDFSDNRVAATLVYRRYTAAYNHRWQGLVGGVSYTPWFVKGGYTLSDMRVMAEWDGCEVNIGADCILWRHLMLQVSLQNFRYVSAGICYTVNLF